MRAKVVAAIMCAGLLCAGVVAGCSQSGTSSSNQVSTNLDSLDMSAWQYNSDDNVYYQIGISYCETPADADYEQLAIFVPGDYLTGTQNEDGTYTCTVNDGATVNGYTITEAPIVMPVNTPGYSAQSALTSYSSSVSTYTDEGFVYVHAGCRGRDAGAPAGVTDLKAAVRYLRGCASELLGDAENIFAFGHSGGGAQSAILGATGDAPEYDAYLESIGAVQGVSDAIAGSMDWCPITNLDTADEAYEWMMGTTRTGLSDDEQAISDALAEAYATYINEAGFEADGSTLSLEASSDGIYQAGSYYEYVKGEIEQSLENFIADTTWPYDASSSSSGGPSGAPGGSGTPNASEENDGISRSGSSSSSSSLSGTYETAQDYIDALNADGEWVSYDSSTGEVTITSIEAFTTRYKGASKSLGAFDQLDAGQGENTLFGYGDGNGAHFDATLASILKELGSSYASDYESDLAKTDSLGVSVTERVNMYTPLYYLLESQDGYGTATPAKYWRIRTGITQGDTSLTTEINLALALEAYDGVESVDFATVWGQGHTQAERTGSSTSNFIDWVNECLK